MDKLNFKTFGEGDPVVIVHGLFGMLDNWKTFARHLAKDYMVYIVDLRNHGKSPHLEGMNYKLMAQDLAHFLEAEWIYEARFIGHSMGGKVVMQLSVDYPEIIEQQMIVDIGPKKYEGGHQTIFEALLSAPIQTAQQRSEIQDHLKQYIQELDVIQFLMKNVSRVPAGGFRWKMNLHEIHAHYQDILNNIDIGQTIEVPTLFVRGAKSNYINDELSAIIKQQFLNAQIETIDAGHWIHAEKPEELLTLCKEFFQQS